jgi:hypothetical protein
VSGELHPPGSAAGSPGSPGSAPLFTPAQAQVLLDQVIYEQVLECVDVDALVRLEQSLALMADELDGVGYDRACELARSMLDRAILRLPDDVRRYLRAAVLLSFDSCELREDEARQSGRRDGTAVTATTDHRRSPRPNS